MARRGTERDGLLGRKRVRLCREGGYYLAVCGFVLLGSILRDVNLLLVVACMMIGPFALNGLVAAGMLRRLRVTRDLPRSVEAGLEWAGAYQVGNEYGRTSAWTLLLGDRIRRVGRAESWPVEAYVSYVPWRTGTRVGFAGPPLVRGLYQWGPLTVQTRFPFGLLVASASASHEDSFFVTPQLGQLGANWVSWLQRAERTGRSGGNRNGRSEGEFHSMRDWRAGDPRKWIHWRTTARRNVLTVREWEVSQSQDLVVLLDLHFGEVSPYRVSPQADHDTERLISFVASLVVRQCMRGGTRLLLGIAGQEVALVSGVAGYRLQEELLQRLAVAEPTSQSTVPALLQRLQGQVSPDALVLFVSHEPPSFPPSSDARLVAHCWHVPVLTSHFRSVFSLPGEHLTTVGLPAVTTTTRTDAPHIKVGGDAT